LELLMSGNVEISTRSIPSTVVKKIQGVLGIKDFSNCVKHIFLTVMPENNYNSLLLALKMDAEFQLLDHVKKEEEDKKKKTKAPAKRKTFLKVHALQSLHGLGQEIIEILLDKLTSKKIRAADFEKRIKLAKLEVLVIAEALQVYILHDKLIERTEIFQYFCGRRMFAPPMSTVLAIDAGRLIILIPQYHV
jgi:hypothetical protein